MKIQELTLYTSRLKEITSFYAAVLEFEIHEKTEGSIAFLLGESILRFVEHKNSSPYHFAFNIPSNKEIEALEWLKGRVDVLKLEGKEIVDFASWNAKAMYFYDADKNIVEFISRRDLEEKSDENFTSQSILNISEIGIGTNHIEEVYDKLTTMRNIDIFDGGFEKFCAVGNDHGMFIIVNKTKKKWYPTNDIIYESDFVIKGDYNFEFTNGKINEIA